MSFNVDIPSGAVREKTPKGPELDRTAWTVVADPGRRRDYFRTYNNKNWHYVEVMEALKNAQGIVNLPMAISPDYPNATATATPL